MNHVITLKRSVLDTALFSIPNYFFLPVPIHRFGRLLGSQSKNKELSILTMGYGCQTLAASLLDDFGRNIQFLQGSGSELHVHNAGDPTSFSRTRVELMDGNQNPQYDAVISLSQTCAHVDLSPLNQFYKNLIKSDGVLYVMDWFLGPTPFEAPMVPAIDHEYEKMQFRSDVVTEKLMRRNGLNLVDKVDLTTASRNHLATELMYLQNSNLYERPLCVPNYKKLGRGKITPLLWLQDRLNQSTLKTSVLSFRKTIS